MQDCWTLFCACCYGLLFCSDQQQQTTWIHPVTGHPVQTGYLRDPSQLIFCLVWFYVAQNSDLPVIHTSMKSQIANYYPDPEQSKSLYKVIRLGSSFGVGLRLASETLLFAKYLLVLTKSCLLCNNFPLCIRNVLLLVGLYEFIVYRHVWTAENRGQRPLIKGSVRVLEASLGPIDLCPS